MKFSSFSWLFKLLLTVTLNISLWFFFLNNFFMLLLWWCLLLGSLKDKKVKGNMLERSFPAIFSLHDWWPCFANQVLVRTDEAKMPYWRNCVVVDCTTILAVLATANRKKSLTRDKAVITCTLFAVLPYSRYLTSVNSWNKSSW